MADRRSFLAALGAGGAALALGRRADAAQPAPTPAASGSPKPSSDVALAFARKMRRFDPGLTDAEIRRIARDIDANAKGAEALNRRGRALRNWDEPVTAFRVAR